MAHLWILIMEILFVLILASPHVKHIWNSTGTHVCNITIHLTAMMRRPKIFKTTAVTGDAFVSIIFWNIGVDPVMEVILQCGQTISKLYYQGNILSEVAIKPGNGLDSNFNFGSVFLLDSFGLDKTGWVPNVSWFDLDFSYYWFGLVWFGLVTDQTVSNHSNPWTEN